MTRRTLTAIALLIVMFAMAGTTEPAPILASQTGSDVRPL